jgi:plastocyanin
VVFDGGLQILTVRGSRWLTLVLVLVASACGDKMSPSVPTPSNPNPNRITITSSGVSASELVVALGATVLFVNNDSQLHNMASDPHPDHGDCPAINLVGPLVPGQSRETGNLVVPGTCGFHDHDNPTINALKGRIVIR